MPVFDMQVPYKDVYHFEIQPQQQPTKAPHTDHVITTEVWHSIEFGNKSDHMLTTAPVLITRGGHQFVCQETLTFTLINNPVFIHLTKAPGIRVTHDETASPVQQPAGATTMKVVGQNYVQEQWSGNITVTSGMHEAVTLVLKIQLLTVICLIIRCSPKPMSFNKTTSK